MNQDINKISSRVIEIAENIILLIIGIATLYAATVEAIRMISTFEVNLRKAAQADYFSTLEAIVTVLNSVERPCAEFSQLLDVMDWMIEQQLGFINNNDVAD